MFAKNLPPGLWKYLKQIEVCKKPTAGFVENLRIFAKNLPPDLRKMWDRWQKPIDSAAENRDVCQKPTGIVAKNLPFFAPLKAAPLFNCLESGAPCFGTAYFILASSSETEKFSVQIEFYGGRSCKKGNYLLKLIYENRNCDRVKLSREHSEVK